jgi:hypothetical protein
MKVKSSLIRGEMFSTKTANDKITVSYSSIINGPELTLEDDSIILLPDFTSQLDRNIYNAGTKDLYLENLTLICSDDTANETYYKDIQIDNIEKYQLPNMKKYVYRLIKY